MHTKIVQNKNKNKTVKGKQKKKGNQEKEKGSNVCVGEKNAVREKRNWA